MGLFDSISNIAKKVVTAVMPTKAKIENVGAVLNAAFNPFSKDTVVANVSNPTLKKSLELVANHPYVSAGVVAGGITAVTNPSSALSAAKTLIPTTTKGKIIAAVAAPIVVGAVAQKPLESAKALISAPSNLANFGGNAANLIASPSVSNLKTLAKENPILTGAAALATAVTVGGGIGLAANTAATFINSQATKANTAASLGGTEDLPVTVVDKSGQFQATPATGGTAIAPSTPITPQTQAVSKSGVVRRRKRKSMRSTPTNISQKVNVVVANKTTTTGISNRRFINREVLLN